MSDRSNPRLDLQRSSTLILIIQIDANFALAPWYKPIISGNIQEV